MADALDLGSSVFDVGVQVPSSAPKQPTYLMVCRLFFVIGRDLNPKRAFDVKQNSPVNCFVVKRCADGYRSQRLGSASKKGAQQPCPFIFKRQIILCLRLVFFGRDSQRQKQFTGLFLLRFVFIRTKTNYIPDGM